MDSHSTATVLYKTHFILQAGAVCIWGSKLHTLRADAYNSHSPHAVLMTVIFASQTT